MLLIREVDKGKERGKRPLPELQKYISDRGDPEGHQSRATLDPF